MPEELKFWADAMLGRLAKWLRVLGCDTHYRGYYGEDAIKKYVREGRKLLSRRERTLEEYPDVFLIRANHVGEQLLEMKSEGYLKRDPSEWFNRCLLCNRRLIKADPATARESVPEYVFYNHTEDIRICPSCNRFFWPGTHRDRMIGQLKKWGF